MFAPNLKPLILPILLAACLGTVSAGESAMHKLRVSDAATADALIAQGAKLIGRYENFQVLESERVPVADLTAGRAQLADEFNELRLNARLLNTRAPEVQALRQPVGAFAGRHLHLVQFAGPIQPEWRAALEKSGAQIVSYLPQNAFLIYGDGPALTRVQALAGTAGFVQWEGAYAGDYKIHPRARTVDEKGNARAIGTEVFSIQLVADAAANAATLQLIDRLKLAPIRRQSKVLNYQNILVALPAAQLPVLAAQPDVVSIHPYFEPRKHDERQAQILAGNLAANLPVGPGYLTWLASKGFTQAQFDQSGFVVDVSDSGIDNGTTAPGHYGLYAQGSTLQSGRVVYNRLEGLPNTNSTLAGCDGHGTLNTHIIAGYDGYTNHLDAGGFSYELGVCPFVKVGSSVVFDPDNFTTPDYPTLQTEAYNSGARISNNSWGSSAAGAYDSDAQSYDALVRDVGATASQRQMVIVFVAGNDGPGSGSSTPGIDSPGTAKNIISVGAAENVRSLSTANGGLDAAGYDGCTTPDTEANSANDIESFSSRGPCADGRMKPDLMAPGTHVTGGVAQSSPPPPPTGTGSAIACFNSSGTCGLPGSGTNNDPDNFFPLGQEFFTVSTGTSHAAPAVSGACALLRQYFLNQKLAPPSPAMTKAFLMNSARYLTGVGANDTLWSPNQGMGEVNLGTAFDGVQRVLRDQVPADIFTASGQARNFSGVVVDSTQPFRVTLAWTDVPGDPAAAQALVNDLDLVVTIGGKTYKGNVFSHATSVTGGTADSLNNAESVFLPAGLSGPFTVTVTAANIAADAITLSTGAPRQDFALVIYNATQTPVPAIQPGGLALLSEDCVPADGAVDPGETVTMNFVLKNSGTANTTNLVATLLATGGVSAPGGPQTYGALAARGGVATQAFAFTASGACGGTITPTFHLADNGADLGTVSFSIPLGAQAPVFVQNFDGSPAPTLPIGWTTTNNGAQPKWTASRTAFDSAPNAAFSADSAGAGVNALVSPVIPLPTGQSQLTFRQKYTLEASSSAGTGYDGGVLEISIGGGAFTDILAAGGSFLSGGYNDTLSSSFGNPLGGRQAWSGSSGGFVTSVVSLPAAAEGQSVQFQWRCATDSTTGGGGWFIDSVAITGNWCCPSPAPTPPFQPLAGTYNGLFFPPNLVQFGNSGAIGLATTVRGTFTGTLQMGLNRYPVGGFFDPFGFSTSTVKLAGTNALTLRLHWTTAGRDSLITGNVSNGGAAASLVAEPPAFDTRTNKAPFAGSYTLSFPGPGDGSPLTPQGDGYGFATVTAGGQVTLNATLADGTKIIQTGAAVSGLGKSGQFPVFAAWAGGGQALGWLQFTNSPLPTVGSWLSWIKPAIPGAKMYPAGFSLLPQMIGSPYVATNKPLLNFSNAFVILTGGNLAASITNKISLKPNNQLVNLSSNQLTLTLNTAQGSFSGSVINPASKKLIPFNGAILQNQNFGSGWFSGTNSFGRVYFGP